MDLPYRILRGIFVMGHNVPITFFRGIKWGLKRSMSESHATFKNGEID